MQTTNNQTVLIIDDEKQLNGLLSRIIGLEGYTVLQAYTGKEALKLLAREDVDVVISDVKLPDVSGVDLVKKIKETTPYAEVINLTAFGNITDGVTAIKNGAFDYLVKGDDNDKIIPLLSKAADKARLQRRVYELEKKISGQYNFNSILGSSKAIKDTVDLARRVAVTDTTVLLLGETGTGKEVFAQAIHYDSLRKTNPFVALNCSGFTAELLESELFGYRAGAFTGANKDKKGLLEEASGGTLFLDEIGEMSLDLQAKLLRVLENQTFIKVGDTNTSKVNVRVIAATNRDLQKQADEGKFRLDLYYRLSVFSITLPSLAERKEDIELLANYYLDQFARKVNKPAFKTEPQFISLLKKHRWKGNIRELKNIMERVAILADSDIITAALLPFEFHTETDTNTFSLETVEKHHIQKVLHHTGGNKTETARLLGIGLTTLYRKLEEYGLSAGS